MLAESRYNELKEVNEALVYTPVKEIAIKEYVSGDYRFIDTEESLREVGEWL